MKKYLSYILLVLLVPILFLTGCGKSEPTEIALTTENYNSYISFNVEYGDLILDKENNTMYCTAKITTSAIVGNVSFRHTNITFSLNPTSVNSWRPVNDSLDKNVKTDIDYTGHSVSTITLKAGILLSTNCLPTTNTNDIKIESITGQVIVK